MRRVRRDLLHKAPLRRRTSTVWSDRNSLGCACRRRRHFLSARLTWSCAGRAWIEREWTAIDYPRRLGAREVTVSCRQSPESELARRRTRPAHPGVTRTRVSASPVRPAAPEFDRCRARPKTGPARFRWRLRKRRKRTQRARKRQPIALVRRSCKSDSRDHSPRFRGQRRKRVRDRVRRATRKRRAIAERCVRRNGQSNASRGRESAARRIDASQGQTAKCSQIGPKMPKP